MQLLQEYEILQRGNQPIIPRLVPRKMRGCYLVLVMAAGLASSPCLDRPGLRRVACAEDGGAVCAVST
jgi:hypothetical protein